MEHNIDITPQPSHAGNLALAIQEQMQQIVVGQREMVIQLLAGLLADGHLLIEGMPGIAKTLTAKTLAKLISTGFSRIQFTPDLMPGDVLGTVVYNPKSSEFQFKQGPIFSNIVLIDEINRAPAKTQASLFEVMEERQITMDGTTYKLPPPFMVVATQNPVEQEGTYRLPEAQLDRFMMKILVTYPDLGEETLILQRHNEQNMGDKLHALVPVITAEQLAEARLEIRRTHIDQKLINFIAQLICKTRTDRSIYLGASPRASIALMQTAKAISVLHGRNFVIPEDVLQMVYPVLRHRITLTPEREMEGVTTDEVLKELVNTLQIPR